MISVIDGANRSRHTELMDQMFRMRAAVFAARLGWEVTVQNGREVDQFDEKDPVYVLALDEASGSLRGAVRLLPTLGPNMLRDVFTDLMPDRVVASPFIWESSRFAIDPTLGQTGRQGGDANSYVSRTTIELLCGIIDVCQSAGILQVVSVFDARMYRIFRAARCYCELIGTPQRFGKVLTYVGLFETSDAMRMLLCGDRRPLRRTQWSGPTHGHDLAACFPSAE